ncbi:MAG: hypothetical protein ACXAB5_06205, partial [Candidatus Thorarchaeota archaeon]
MGKRLILGTKPEVDPLEEMSGRTTTITTGTEIRWDDRAVGKPLARILLAFLIAIVIGLSIPAAIAIAAAIILSLQFLSPKLR